MHMHICVHICIHARIYAYMLSYMHIFSIQQFNENFQLRLQSKRENAIRTLKLALCSSKWSRCCVVAHVQRTSRNAMSKMKRDRMPGWAWSFSRLYGPSACAPPVRFYRRRNSELFSTLWAKCLCTPSEIRTKTNLIRTGLNQPSGGLQCRLARFAVSTGLLIRDLGFATNGERMST